MGDKHSTPQNNSELQPPTTLNLKQSQTNLRVRTFGNNKVSPAPATENVITINFFDQLEFPEAPVYLKTGKHHNVNDFSIDDHNDWLKEAPSSMGG